MQQRIQYIDLAKGLCILLVVLYHVFMHVNYMSPLVKSLGCKAVRSGASFKSWYEVYHDKDITHTYSVSKVFGQLMTNVSRI